MRVIASAMPPPVQDSAVVTAALEARSAAPSRCARDVRVSIEYSFVDRWNPTPERPGFAAAPGQRRTRNTLSALRCRTVGRSSGRRSGYDRNAVALRRADRAPPIRRARRQARPRRDGGQENVVRPTVLAPYTGKTWLRCGVLGALPTAGSGMSANAGATGHKPAAEALRRVDQIGRASCRETQERTGLLET